MVMISDGTVWVVGCDHQFAYTLMDSASSTEPHIVQVLLTSHCRQIEHSILRYLLQNILNWAGDKSVQTE